MFELFCVFFKIGLFTIGGGYAMIPLMQEEITGRGWMTLEQLTNLMAVAEVTPGPFAVNTATFVGMQTEGVTGALVATCGVILPSFLILLVVARCFAGFSDNRWVKAGMTGVRPAVLGLISAAVWTLGLLLFFKHKEGALFSWQGLDVATAVIFVVLLAVEWRFKLHPVKLIGLAMVLGMLVFSVIMPRVT